MKVSQRIRDWFECVDQNHGWKESIAITDEINAMIAEMPEPLPESAEAWKRWQAFERQPTRHDPGLYIAMDMCMYTEWCAAVELGLTDLPFEGVPKIIITSV